MADALGQGRVGIVPAGGPPARDQRRSGLGPGDRGGRHERHHRYRGLDAGRRFTGAVRPVPAARTGLGPRRVITAADLPDPQPATTGRPQRHPHPSGTSGTRVPVRRVHGLDGPGIGERRCRTVVDRPRRGTRGGGQRRQPGRVRAGPPFADQPLPGRYGPRRRPGHTRARQPGPATDQGPGRTEAGPVPSRQGRLRRLHAQSRPVPEPPRTRTPRPARTRHRRLPPARRGGDVHRLVPLRTGTAAAGRGNPRQGDRAAARSRTAHPLALRTPARPRARRRGRDRTRL